MKNNDNFEVTIQSSSPEFNIPMKLHFKKWIEKLLTNMKINKAEIGIRIVDETESAALNLKYRAKQGPTNVLSFSYQHPIDKTILLGDLIFCAPIISKEAQTQQKNLDAHWAHLVVHGLLHLLGYDHVNEKDREIMEGIEINTLEYLGYDNPYESNL